MQRQIAVDQPKSERLPLFGLEVSRDESLRVQVELPVALGHRTASTQKPTPMKHKIASQAAAETLSSPMACAPKNDVVIAAAAINAPARALISLTTRS